MLGLYTIAGTQHVDNHTTITHAAENCSSRELYKGVLEQRSRAVFHGRIVVRPGAQKTDARQTNNNLLLSKAPKSTASRNWKFTPTMSSAPTAQRSGRSTPTRCFIYALAASTKPARARC